MKNLHDSISTDHLQIKASRPRRTLAPTPVTVAPHALDDDGPLAAGLLLGLGHALTGFNVRVVRGVHFQLLPNHPETQQLLRGAERERNQNKTHKPTRDAERVKRTMGCFWGLPGGELLHAVEGSLQFVGGDVRQAKGEDPQLVSSL